MWVFARVLRSRFAPIYALIVIVAVTGALWSRTSVQPLSEFDQTFYLGIAYDLRHSGRFTDGVFAQVDAGRERPSGMRFAPLYPALLVLAAGIDKDFAAAMDCAAFAGPTDTTCPRSAALVRAVQFAMLAAFFLLCWWVGGELLGPCGAWTTLFLALFCSRLILRFVNYTMTEVTALLLLAASIAAALMARRRGWSVGWLFIAGVLLGLTALTRPANLWLAYAVALVGFVIAVAHRPRVRRLAVPLVFLAGVVVTVGPWVARNAIMLHRPALTHGYDSHTLVQRLAYNEMTWREYLLSFACWLPEGHRITPRLLGEHICDRLEGIGENSFYAIGNTTLMTSTVEAAGGWDNHLSYLIRNYILADPLKHALVTVSLAWLGFHVNNHWGFWLGLLCAGLTVRALRRRDDAFLIVALPGWFMLFFHAAVAVNQVRYNMILALPFAVSGAWLIDRWLCRRARGKLPAPADVIAFWRAAGPEKWFRKDAAFDDEIRTRFLPAMEAAAAGRLSGWEATPEGAFALLILLDQFPRNAFRGDARAFAADPLARAVTNRAIARGFDQRVPDGERLFFYLPFEHSEDMTDQQRAIALVRALGDADLLKWAELHADIVRRFGRFPHRNAALGRTTNAAEQAFLDQGGFAG